MSAIKLNFSKSNNDLFGQSKWWGAPDLPEDWEYPEMVNEEGNPLPLLFLCQIRCSDLATFDTKNLLPHKGMLYFFAAIQDFLEDFDFGNSIPLYHGYGELSKEYFKVLYSPTTDNLSTYEILWEDDTPAYMTEEEAITFSAEKPDDDYGEFYLLGSPTYTEIEENYPDYINLLQIDEEDRWSLRFIDLGQLNFLIKPEDLAKRNFDNVLLHLAYS